MLVAFVAAGVPADLAGPRAWDDLAEGIVQGLGTVPNVRVPYAGAEEWTRVVIVLGGGMLIALGALLAFAPRRGGAIGRPVAAAVALGTLYLVPVMQRTGEHPFLGGATFALLLALFLWLERVELGAARFAAVAVGVAVLAALVVAPRVDADRPLLDYEGIAQSLTSPSTRYQWNHDYGPLDWPRDGSEVLRIRATTRAYWKAMNLPTFDGLRWHELGNLAGTRLDGGLAVEHSDWVEDLRVTVRGLRSTQFVTAGSTIEIRDASRTPIRTEPGQFTTLDRPLRPGNAYRAVVYAPQPSARELREVQLPMPIDATLTALTLPRPGGSDPLVVAIPPWGVAEPTPQTIADIEASPYARAYRLARRLRDRSATPYEFVRAVERHLSRGYLYSERPPPSSRPPLMEFLFGSQRGYCQHFSGAMALLLRLGGVPARVASGFSPGAYDTKRKEYVVRDLDAHSWVEVFFPGIGWVTRDPTPSASPARSQFADRLSADAGGPEPTPSGAAATPPGRGDVAPTITPGRGVADEGSSRRRIAIGVGIAVALAALAAAVLALRRRRRRGEPRRDRVRRRAARRAAARAAPQRPLADRPDDARDARRALARDARRGLRPRARRGALRLRRGAAADATAARRAAARARRRRRHARAPALVVGAAAAAGTPVARRAPRAPGGAALSQAKPAATTGARV